MNNIELCCADMFEFMLVSLVTRFDLLLCNDCCCSVTFVHNDNKLARLNLR
jgi:hypothetical protein